MPRLSNMNIAHEIESIVQNYDKSTKKVIQCYDSQEIMELILDLFDCKKLHVFELHALYEILKQSKQFIPLAYNLSKFYDQEGLIADLTEMNPRKLSDQAILNMIRNSETMNRKAKRKKFFVDLAEIDQFAAQFQSILLFHKLYKTTLKSMVDFAGALKKLNISLDLLESYQNAVGKFERYESLSRRTLYRYKAQKLIDIFDARFIVGEMIQEYKMLTAIHLP